MSAQNGRREHKIMDQLQSISRRLLLVVGGAALVTPLLSHPATAQPAAPRSMIVHRDPGCGCCLAWANLARQAGYAVSLQNSADMSAVKARLGVPAALTSCHTAVVGGYVVEGHVPFAALSRLLTQRPADIRGIAVPGMPTGSPGMETSDGYREPFEVIAFHRNGRTSRFG